MKPVPIPSLEWKITTKCNYHCSYCCQDIPIDKRRQCTEQTKQAVLKLIASLPGQWQIKLIGGEPFVHRDFFDICRYIVEHGHTLSTTTNFSFPLKKFEQFIEITGDRLRTITASLHLEQVKSTDRFIEKAEAFNLIKPRATDFKVTTVFIEEKQDLLKQIARRFEEKQVGFEFQALKIGKKYVRYSAAIEEYLAARMMKSTQKIRKANLMRTLCHSGELFFRIELNGDDVIICSRFISLGM